MMSESSEHHALSPSGQQAPETPRHEGGATPAASMVATCEVDFPDLIDLQTDLQDTENTLSTANNLTPAAASREAPTRHVVDPIEQGDQQVRANRVAALFPNLIPTAASREESTRRDVGPTMHAKPEPLATRSEGAREPPPPRGAATNHGLGHASSAESPLAAAELEELATPSDHALDPIEEFVFLAVSKGAPDEVCDAAIHGSSDAAYTFAREHGASEAICKALKVVVVNATMARVRAGPMRGSTPPTPPPFKLEPTLPSTVEQPTPCYPEMTGAPSFNHVSSDPIGWNEPRAFRWAG